MARTWVQFPVCYRKAVKWLSLTYLHYLLYQCDVTLKTNETWYPSCLWPHPLKCSQKKASGHLWYLQVELSESGGSINKEDLSLGSGSYLLLLWNKVLGLFGYNNNLNFPSTESWWNLEELFFWHKFLPKCCLHPLLRLVWNETLCGRRPSSIRTSRELRWSLELMITHYKCWSLHRFTLFFFLTTKLCDAIEFWFKYKLFFGEVFCWSPNSFIHLFEPVFCFNLLDPLYEGVLNPFLLYLLQMTLSPHLGYLGHVPSPLLCCEVGFLIPIEWLLLGFLWKSRGCVCAGTSCQLHYLEWGLLVIKKY